MLAEVNLPLVKNRQTITIYWIRFFICTGSYKNYNNSFGPDSCLSIRPLSSSKMEKTCRWILLKGYIYNMIWTFNYDVVILCKLSRCFTLMKSLLHSVSLLMFNQSWLFYFLWMKEGKLIMLDFNIYILDWQLKTTRMEIVFPF